MSGKELETISDILQDISNEYATKSRTFELVKEVYEDLITELTNVENVLDFNSSLIKSYFDKDGINLNKDEIVIKEALFLNEVNDK